ncbi:MAG: ABC transporter permease [Anaerolineae bacterium]|nr:ABC transporter permease [Anaerolineae bacterium]
MNVFENLRIALDNLLLNRLRALLTILGIVIGVAAVTSLISLGRGVESYVASQFEGLGADILTIRASPPRRGFNRLAIKPLTTENVTALASGVVAPSVRAVTAEYQVQATVVYGYDSLSSSIRGVSANYAAANDWYPLEGGFFTEQDNTAQAQIALLGSSTVEDLFGSASYDPTGLTILINNLPFTVVGVMEEKSSTFGQDPNSAILVPLLTAQSKLGNARVAGAGYSVSTIQAQLVEDADVDRATDEIEAYLLAEHGITDSTQADFSISNPETISEARTEVFTTLTLFLSAIAAISLLVGGIGVMNIMLVSVSERTREIGLRKAVGARSRDILSQFMIEAIMLSLLGGAGGVLLALGITTIAGQALLSGVTPSLSPDVLLLATGVCSAIGILFGLYPANRAARMQPIQALRFE